MKMSKMSIAIMTTTIMTGVGLSAQAAPLVQLQSYANVGVVGSEEFQADQPDQEKGKPPIEVTKSTIANIAPKSEFSSLETTPEETSVASYEGSQIAIVDPVPTSTPLPQ